jgi:hypothetical protein
MAARRLNPSLFADRRCTVPVNKVSDGGGEQELVVSDELAVDIQLRPAGTPLALGEAGLAGGLEPEPQLVPALGQCVRRAHLSSRDMQDYESAVAGLRRIMVSPSSSGGMDVRVTGVRMPLARTRNSRSPPAGIPLSAGRVKIRAPAA